MNPRDVSDGSAHISSIFPQMVVLSAESVRDFSSSGAISGFEVLMLFNLVIRLFDNTVPYTTHNFRCFTNGYRGVSYVGTSFFQIDPYGLMGGDFQQNDGGGGWSVYGTTFKGKYMTSFFAYNDLFSM